MSETTFSTVTNKKFTLLLFGETGSGKSTTVNALANYLKFPSFDEANKQLEQLLVVCPVQFALPNPETGNTMTIQMGEDDPNERFGNADSVTQNPICYRFMISDVVVDVIDTPGIGDTNGTEVDKHNFEKVMCFLKTYDELSAIIFIVDGCNSRMTHFFKYCVSEMLNNLHHSILPNIMFCYTHSRISMYGPGEGFKTMQELLDGELKSSGLQMNIGVNCFFVDNEAFRYLVAKKQQYQFDPELSMFFKVSWNKSVQQMGSMFEAIRELPAHQIYKTTTLYNAKKMINELAEPMVQLQKNFLRNIEEIELQEKEPIRASPKEQMESATKLETRKLNYQSTVCTAQDCVKIQQTSDHREIYKTRCHENCNCFGVIPQASCKSLNMFTLSFNLYCLLLPY